MIKHKEEIREIIEYYAKQRNPKEQENLAAMLREIQDIEGCIPREAQEQAANLIGIKTSVLSCIVRFYPGMKEEAYIHELVVCTGERCQKKNSMELLRAVKRELGIQKGNLSADGRIQLVTKNCMKKCGTSPNMILDGEHYPDMTAEKAVSLIRSLKEKNTKEGKK